MLVRPFSPLLLVALALSCGPGLLDDPPPASSDGGGGGVLAGADGGTPNDGGGGLDAGKSDGGGVLVDGGGTGQTDAGADAGTHAGADAGTDAGRDAGFAERLRVVVLSDLNGSYGSTTYESTVHQAVRAVTQSLRPDVVLVSGDMVAGQQAGLNYAAMWQGFHAAVTTPLKAASIPVLPAPGNHDASAYSGYQSERAEYARQWNDPARKPPVQFVDATSYPFHYSFVVRGVFFVALDATTVGPLPAGQRAWVDSQLSQASAYPVKVVFGHVPLHPATVGRETEVLSDGALERIMKDRGVAVFIAGHHHGYFPGASGGLRQVVMPCLGAGPRELIGTSTVAAKALVVVDVEGAKVKSIEALPAPSFGAPILRSSLPRELRHGSHVLQRDDLAGF